MVLNGNGYRGPLYRALNPVYARMPLSGRGAELHGGRFNPKGIPALYSALDPVTALREANQVGSLQPTILVSYRADIVPVFDTREAAQLAAFGMTSEALADPGWRLAMLGGRRVPTQDFASALIAEGYAGLLVRSFAKGALDTDLNLVLWRWGEAGCSLEVVDDEARLDRM
ncbi:MAG: RES family NAD+ phosphorylase [Thiotrichales bacterium]